MAPWINAQFGPGPLGNKAFCHLLEIQANVSATDQVAAMVADVPNGPYTKRSAGPTWSQLVADSNPPKYTPLLGPDYANGDDDLRRNMIAWATCDYVGKGPRSDLGGWNVDSAFVNVFTTPPSNHAQTCSTWWGQGNTKPPPKGGTFTTNGPFDFEDENAIHSATTVPGHDSPDARNYIQGLNGHNAGLALSTSLIALVSSITYAWSLGGLALGVLIGKLSLIILVACAPIFLLLAAIPSATTRRAARKAFGLSFAALLSSFTFSVLMGLLLLFIGLLQDVAIGLFPDQGTLPGLIEGLIPLAALFLLRKLLRLVGMESITSLRGAIKTTAAFGQMGTTAGAPAAHRSRLRQVTDLAGAADALRGRRSGPRPFSVGMDRPTLPDNRGRATAPSLPWNRSWRALMDSRPSGAAMPNLPAGPAPPPALTAGRPPPTAPMLTAGQPPPAAPSLTAGPAPPAALSRVVGPSPRRASPDHLPGLSVGLRSDARPERTGRLLLPAGVTHSAPTGTDPTTSPGGTVPVPEPGGAASVPEAAQGDTDPPVEESRSLWLPPSR